MPSDSARAALAAAGFPRKKQDYVTAFTVGVCLKTVPKPGEAAGEAFVDEVGADPDEMLVTMRVTDLASDVVRATTAAQLQQKFATFLTQRVENFAKNFTVKKTKKQDVMSNPYESVEWISYGTRPLEMKDGQVVDHGGTPALSRAIFEIVQEQRGLAKEDFVDQVEEESLEAKHEMVISVGAAFAQFLNKEGGEGDDAGATLVYKDTKGGAVDIKFHAGSVRYDDGYGIAFFPMHITNVAGEMDEEDVDRANESVAVSA
jgi:hypothetical protein